MSIVAHNEVWSELCVYVTSVPVSVTLAVPSVTACPPFAGLAKDVSPAATVTY